MKAANERGFIEAAVRISRYRDKYGLILCVKVIGPITFLGEEFLDRAEADERDGSASPLLLEPNFFGIGLRLPELWRKFKGVFRR